MKTPLPILPENFKGLVEERIQDPVLRRNLEWATSTSLKKRKAVVSEFENWEQMRRAGHEIKRHVMEFLPWYLQQFADNAEKSGSQIHFATDAAEACRIVLDIARKNGVGLAVKSKSMTTEEIELGHALAEAGIEAVETDLGEYIVQLAGEIPSHITAPALHKSREQIGRLFSERLGLPYTSDPEKLTAVARDILRRKFLNADLGISGVNFAVAESGAICIVENEGNVRLSVSLPRIHVAVMGMEKLLPETRSLGLFLEMLARSATGQRITSYTSILSGPRNEDEKDGPEEVHIVILDNGRTDMLKDPRLREALYCIRCGACMNTCPVYQKIGGHSYGSIYPGPIGSVITPVQKGLRSARYLPFASSLCGACSEICPVHIDIHHMLLWHRKSIIGAGHSSSFERLLMKGFLTVMKYPLLYRISGKLASMFSPLLLDANGSLKVPVWSKTRDFPLPAKKTFREMWKERER